MATTSREQLKAWFRKGLKPLESQFAAWIDSYWHKSDSIPMSSIDGLNDALNDHTIIADDTLDTASTNPIQNAPVATALEGKSDVGHTHTPSDITGLETALEEATTNKMNRDGSNYQGSLALVSPVVTSRWTIRKQDGTQVATKTDNAISLENGAKADYSGTFLYPAADAAHKAPASCDGAFGTTLPEPGTPSAALTKTGLTANTSLTVNLYAPKSGLEVSGGKVVKATGEDKTSATASVSFYHRRYWGVSADAAADITALTSELSNARAKTLTFDCSGGRYFYYAYPKALGTAAWKVGGLDFTGYTRTEQTITNEYGLAVAYYVYRSSDLQTGSNINAVIS